MSENIYVAIWWYIERVSHTQNTNPHMCHIQAVVSSTARRSPQLSHIRFYQRTACRGPAKINCIYICTRIHLLSLIFPNVFLSYICIVCVTTGMVVKFTYVHSVTGCWWNISIEIIINFIRRGKYRNLCWIRVNKWSTCGELCELL